jgi:hypothetical protein
MTQKKITGLAMLMMHSGYFSTIFYKNTVLGLGEGEHLIAYRHDALLDSILLGE